MYWSVQFIYIFTYFVLSVILYYTRYVLEPFSVYVRQLKVYRVRDNRILHRRQCVQGV